LGNETLGSGIGVGCAVDEVKIEPAIIIAIEERDPGAHGFKKVFARSVRGLVQKMHTGLVGNVDKFCGNRGLG
jgi:hypothetical protein